MIKVTKKCFYCYWVISTVILTVCFILIGIKVLHINNEVTVSECLLENSMIGLPSVKVIETEVRQENIVNTFNYSFPFAVEKLGEFNIIPCTLTELPQRKYSEMKNVSGVSIFASSNVLEEGSLIWVEDVGIRQVQPLKGISNSIYLVFNSIEEKNMFKEPLKEVFKILE